MEEKKFDVVDSNEELNKESFVFVQEDKKIKDVNLKSKPTTFFKDALKRFSKNKSSVVATYILGFLIILTIILPVAIPYDTSVNHNYQIQLPAKLFDAGTGFWDGTKEYTEIPYDQENECPAGFKNEAILDGTLKIKDVTINDVHPQAKGGYVYFWQPRVADNAQVVDNYMQSPESDFYLDHDYVLKLETFSTADYVADTKASVVDSNYYINFVYTDQSEGEIKEITLLEKTKDFGQKTINITEKVLAAKPDLAGTLVEHCKIKIYIEANKTSNNGILFKNVDFAKYQDDQLVEDAALDNLDIFDANKTIGNADVKSDTYWICTGQKNIYKADLKQCSFVYDEYLASFGEIKNFKFGETEVKKYVAKGWMKIDLNADDPVSTFELLSDKCPIRTVEQYKKTKVGKVEVVEVIGTCSMYRYKGYDTMPIYLFGTDNDGKDLLKITFSGLRTSLLLGLCTFLFCFIFGLIWGSISGYFGGNVDLAMERFCDILGGMPSIVIMTLLIINFGSSFFVFALSLCMTGWMGTAARTRTQFYRYKGREYVLASRTLGASDFRLIFKHILPNSMGTIITSSVLMIPSVIYSEATISYLGLGLQDLDSFGIILSSNQQYISSNPMLILFPSVVMALMMISFNLFGNGLRDAFNPSLKGSE